MIRSDTTAAEMIPIRLMISIAVIAAITFLAFTGFQKIQSTSEMDSFEKELRMLKSELSLLYATGEPRDIQNPYASNGTTRVFSFHVPPSVALLSFESDSLLLPLHDTTSSESSSAFLYQTTTGHQEVIWCDSPLHFCKGIFVDSRWICSSDKPIFTVAGGGKLDLTFELVSQNETLFILIY